MEKVDITTVVELLNNMLYLASAYNQLWTIRTVDINGSICIAFVDERSEEIKTVFFYPDEKMQAATAEIQEKGWAAVKKEYLIDNPFNEARVRLCEQECKCHCHN